MPGTSDWRWMRESGACSKATLPELVRAFTRAEDKAVAFYVDRFQAANVGFVPALLEGAENLLELRIFRTDAEFLARRSALGAEFSWRIADDAALWENVEEQDFEAVKKRHIILTTQILDISPDYVPYRTGERDAFGCRKLRSSVGGRYALPFDDEKDYGCVRIANYVSYNQYGIAGVADFRIVGFEPLSKGEDSA